MTSNEETAPAASVVALKGSCSISTTDFRNGFGSPRNETKPIMLSLRVEPGDAMAEVRGTVLVSSAWDTIPEHLWRAWCNQARGYGEPLTSPCSIGPFELAVDALDFGDGYVQLIRTAEGYSLTFSSTVESEHASYYDSYTRTSAFCTLR